MPNRGLPRSGSCVSDPHNVPPSARRLYVQLWVGWLCVKLNEGQSIRVGELPP